MIKKLILILISSVFLTGCLSLQDKRKLDPKGVYKGDEFLWKFDGAFLEFAETTSRFLDVADRNPIAVSENQGLKDFVKELRDTRSRTLVKAKNARSLYLAVKDAETKAILTDRERLMNLAIAQARQYLVLLATSD